MDVQSEIPQQAPHFGQGTRYEARQGPMQSLTRYLSAAMYLDKGLCDQVLKEYVYELHRAIVPSHGYDLEPVIRHARRARLLRLGRDAMLVGIWVVLYLMLPGLAVAYVMLFSYTAVLVRVPWRRLSGWWRLGLALILSWPLMWALGLVLAAVAAVLILPAGFLGDAGIAGRARLGVAMFLAVVLPLTAGYAVAVIGHLFVVLRLLARDLWPGAAGPGPGPAVAPQAASADSASESSFQRFARAVRRVRTAQDGNITLYSGDNPFIGAGHPHSSHAKVWSIVLELDRERPGSKGGPDGPAPVDPVVMHERISARLHQMRDDVPSGGTGGSAARTRPLPPNERISGLVTGWHVTAHGRRVRRPLQAGEPLWDHPLIDPSWRAPHSVASPAAVAAIIRHPRAGVRCFQRVTVGAQRQAVSTAAGVPVAPAEEQDVALTAFVHLAVEGRMLYGQFAATVLPPVRPAFRIVDELYAWSRSRMLWRALVAGRSALFVAPLLAPQRLAWTLWRMSREAFATQFPVDPAREPVYDFGARISVRELAADDDFHDFIQELDADKYTRLIERRVNEALLDYLGDECGIDVSVYRAQAGFILNQGVIMTGGTVHGQVAAGRRVDQRQTDINP